MRELPERMRKGRTASSTGDACSASSTTYENDITHRLERERAVLALEPQQVRVAGHAHGDFDVGAGDCPGCRLTERNARAATRSTHRTEACWRNKNAPFTMRSFFLTGFFEASGVLAFARGGASGKARRERRTGVCQGRPQMGQETRCTVHRLSLRVSCSGGICNQKKRSDEAGARNKLQQGRRRSRLRDSETVVKPDSKRPRSRLAVPSTTSLNPLLGIRAALPMAPSREQEDAGSATSSPALHFRFIYARCKSEQPNEGGRT
jgi:hypothetical protein